MRFIFWWVEGWFTRLALSLAYGTWMLRAKKPLQQLNALTQQFHSFFITPVILGSGTLASKNGWSQRRFWQHLHLAHRATLPLVSCHDTLLVIPQTVPALGWIFACFYFGHQHSDAHSPHGHHKVMLVFTENFALTVSPFLPLPQWSPTSTCRSKSKHLGAGVSFQDIRPRNLSSLLSTISLK